MNISDSLSIIQASEDNARLKDLRRASQDMEATFISMMIKAMERTIPESPLGGSQNNLAKMMFSSVMSTEIAEQGGFGFSDIIFESLKEEDISALEDLQRLPGPATLLQLNSNEESNEKQQTE